MAFGPQSEQERYRSFAERYLIARAHHFRLGHEQEDGWQCALDAKSLYDSISNVSKKYIPQPEDAVASAPPPQQVTGMTGAQQVTHRPRSNKAVPNVGRKTSQDLMDYLRDLINTGASPQIIETVKKLIAHKVREEQMAAPRPQKVIDSRGWTGGGW